MMEVDLHIHSKYSRDSLLSPRLILKVAKKKGLSAVAVTDHGTLEGAREMVREARRSNELLALSGVEVKTSIGDVIGLFVEEEIAARDFYDVIDEIKRQHGIIILSHPFRNHKEIPKQALSDIDLVETLNGRSSNRENSKALVMALSYDKAIVAGSDAHFSFEIGCVRTVFSDQVTDLEELRKLITAGERRLIGRESLRIVHAFSFGVEMIKRTGRWLGAQACPKS
jgi:hypothetical protein